MTPKDVFGRIVAALDQARIPYMLTGSFILSVEKHRHGRAVMANARFSVGDLVRHKLFGYRGVIFDVDPRLMLSEEWYEAVALTRPPRDQPWYRVLVDNAGHETYVAERNLAPDASGSPISHPLIETCFSGFRDGRYRPLDQPN